MPSIFHSYSMKRVTLIFTLFLLSLVSSAQTVDNDSLIPGSQREDFVTVSLLIASPGNSIYSVFGHCALRLQCPSQHLDYVYTFETENGLAGYIKFFAGQAKAGFAAITPQEYLTPYKKEGRGVVAYPLNLTPHEKQELWRALDEDMEQGPHRKYNLIKNQCISMSFLMLETILEDEFIDYDRLPRTYSNLNNGELVRKYSESAPWGQFLYLTFMGSEADDYWEPEFRFAPGTMSWAMPTLRFVSIDRTKQRPMLKGSPRVLQVTTLHPQPSPVSPEWVFGLLLLFTIIITLAQCLKHGQKLAHAYDVTLFTLQSIAGVFLLYVTLVSGLFGLHWNWYLILFNPLPLLLWLLFRHQVWYNKLFRIYTVVLVLSIPLLFLVTVQADLPHAMIIASLAIRSGYKGWADRRQM